VMSVTEYADALDTVHCRVSPSRVQGAPPVLAPASRMGSAKVPSRVGAAPNLTTDTSTSQPIKHTGLGSKPVLGGDERSRRHHCMGQRQWIASTSVRRFPDPQPPPFKHPRHDKGDCASQCGSHKKAHCGRIALCSHRSPCTTSAVLAAVLHVEGVTEVTTGGCCITAVSKALDTRPAAVLITTVPRSRVVMHSSWRCSCQGAQRSLAGHGTQRAASEWSQCGAGGGG
jgi:hypothetical protein